MILTIGLTNFLGADVKVIDGEPCVVIPVQPNGRMVTRRGRKEVFSEIVVNPSSNGRKYDYTGKLLIPENQLDRVLESPKYIYTNKSIAWGYNQQSEVAKARGGIMSEADFDRLINDKL